VFSVRYGDDCVIKSRHHTLSPNKDAFTSSD
jgi:hypothetical protein